MYCSKCGSNIADNASFCPECGAATNNTNNVSNQPSQQTSSTGSSMSTKNTGIIAYITWIGWIIAYCTGDKEGAKFHLNQALVLNLFGMLGGIPFVGWAWAVFIFVCWILGLISACEESEKEVPLLGSIKILK